MGLPAYAEEWDFPAYAEGSGGNWASGILKPTNGDYQPLSRGVMALKIESEKPKEPSTRRGCSALGLAS